MCIKEINFLEFDNFAKNHQLNNMYQTSEYALLKSNQGFEYDYIAYVNNNDEILAAALILHKKIGLKYKYGYAPKGFLIDYMNIDLLHNFTEAIKKYYASKNFVFIKINPDIAIGKITLNPVQVKYNQNVLIRNYLKDNGYTKLKDNLYFESLFPRFNGIIHLPSFNYQNLRKNTKNKIQQAKRKGLCFEKANREDIDTLFQFIKFKKNRELYYYKDYYNMYDKNKLVDLFLVRIDYEDYLVNSKKAYEEELEKNNYYNMQLYKNSTEKKINIKMNSDRVLLSYKNDIIDATNGLKENKKVYIAGAMTVRFKNRVYLIVSGYDKKYERFNPNYYLHYELLKYYQNDFTFFDLNGLTGDFTYANPYYGLNQFKLGFNSRIYEFIGGYDLVINESVYKKFEKNNTLAKEFNKKNLKQAKKTNN